MAKSRWVNIQFIGAVPTVYKGFQIHEVEVYYSTSGVTYDEFAIFDNNMRCYGHFPTLAEGQQFLDKWVP